MSRFLAEKYIKLAPYVPGEQPKDKKFIKLNTNESPYPAGPKTIAAVTENGIKNLRLYSDPDSTELKERLAEVYGVKKEWVFVSNGSDDIINFAFMAFGGEGAAFADVTYGFYPVFANINGVKALIKPLKDDFTIDVNDYLYLNKLIVIANPNAPTGICLKLYEIEEILRTNRDNVVVIDEAYIDFGGESALPLVFKYDNLLVVRTFSKSRSLAGARLGFAIGSKGLIDDLERIKYSTNPYNVNSLTSALGIGALSEEDYYRENCKKIADTREFTARELTNMGFCVLPSKSNFIFCKKDGFYGEEIYEFLRGKGILVRYWNKPRIAEYVRITIGLRDDMETMLACLKELRK